MLPSTTYASKATTRSCLAARSTKSRRVEPVATMSAVIQVFNMSTSFPPPSAGGPSLPHLRVDPLSPRRLDLPAHGWAGGADGGHPPTSTRFVLCGWGTIRHVNIVIPKYMLLPCVCLLANILHNCTRHTSRPNVNTFSLIPTQC